MGFCPPPRDIAGFQRSRPEVRTFMGPFEGLFLPGAGPRRSAPRGAARAHGRPGPRTVQPDHADRPTVPVGPLCVSRQFRKPEVVSFFARSSGRRALGPTLGMAGNGRLDLRARPGGMSRGVHLLPARAGLRIRFTKSRRTNLLPRLSGIVATGRIEAARDPRKRLVGPGRRHAGLGFPPRAGLVCRCPGGRALARITRTRRMVQGACVWSFRAVDGLVAIAAPDGIHGNLRPAIRTEPILAGKVQLPRPP